MPSIPPLFAWALRAMGAVMVLHLAMKEIRRVNAELDRIRRGQAAGSGERDSRPTLKRDPATGEYRPG
jgi:hypothetical protein